ncbi:hypothetical protein [Cognatilysobacter lacus]|uniref:DUF4410 domain-containing protein n=1 Tax=Cognatilysobacter lacus TaxID=1643323 RepID=A0A5D8YZQ3_9GAMM|nr:hypothetical protein [Lysobacter lacus]TZF87959.1 hypothetical protein FW784_10500 [Lysobacter lacus]
MFRRALATAVLALAFNGPLQATPAFNANERNPPPSVALSTFDRYELAPLVLADGLAAYKANVIAQRYLQVDLEERIRKLVDARNAKAAGETSRTLLLTPEIADVRFITGGKRLLFGGFGGKSWAVLKLHLVDKASGEVIAEPHFEQRAYGIFAGYSLGAADKLMLARLADMAASYLDANVETPVGAPVATAARAMD